jgi:hypothetical protein
MKAGKKTGCWLAALALIGFIGAFQTKALADQDAKQIVAELQQIKNPDKPFTIAFKTANGAQTATVGETVSFVFAADRECYLYIIDIGTSGKAHVLFPNQWQQANKAEPNRVYMLPPQGSNVVFRVKGPEGVNYLKAIATLKPIESVERAATKGEGPFAEILNPAEAFKDVAAELSQQTTKNWAEAELAVKVVKGGEPAPAAAPAPAPAAPATPAPAPAPAAPATPAPAPPAAGEKEGM